MLKNLCTLILLLLVTAGCSKSSRLSRHLERADGAWQKGDFETARIEYLNALQLSPENPQAISRLGLVFFERGEILPAAQLLGRAKELQPTNTAVRLKLGAIFIAIGRFTNAVEEAEYVLTQSPANPDAAVLLANATPRAGLPQLQQRLQSLAPSSGVHLALGIVYDRSGQKEAAEAAYKKALELDSKNSKAALALGNFYWSENNTNQASALLKNAADLSQVRSVERLRFAEFQLRNGQPQEGKKVLEETVAKAPDFIPALNALAEVYFIERRTNECSAYLGRVLQIDSRNPDALILRSKLRQVQGDSSGAVEDLEQITRANANHVPALYELALLYRSRNDQTRALATIERALSVRSNFVQGILLRSELLATTGDFAAAIPPLVRLTNQAPNNPTPYYLLASALRARGTPEEALAVYRRAAQVFPGDPQPFQYTGMTLRQQKRYPEARDAYLRALQVQTNYLPAIDDLIELDVLATNYSAALQRVQGYIDLYPDKPMPRLLQAKVFVAQTNWSQAEASLQKAIEIAPDFYMAHRSLATLYVASKQTDHAIQKLENLIKTNSKDAGSMLQLGMLYEANGKHEQARATYEKLLEVQPNSVYALNNLAYLSSEHFKDNEKAWALIQRARAQNPADPFVADTFGWIAFQRGDYTRALSVLQQAAERLPDKPEVIFHLGMSYYMAGQENQAAVTLASALNAKGEFPGREQAKAALAILQIDPRTPKPADKAFLAQAVQKSNSDLFAHIRLAQLQEQERDWEKAWSSWEAARKISPRSSFILAQLAAINAERFGRSAEALALAKEAWTIAQDSVTAATVGRVGVLAGDTRWALPILQIAARAQPQDPVLAYFQALAAYANVDFRESAASLERARSSAVPFPQRSQADAFHVLLQFQTGAAGAPEASTAAAALLKESPSFRPARITAGRLAELNGDFAAARAYYEAVLKDAPDYLLAQRHLAVLLADRLGDDNAASSLAAKVRVHLPDDPLIAATLGKIAFRRGDHREAARLLSSAAPKLPKNAETLYYLGLSEFHLKQKGAKAALTEALALDPSATLAADARKALAELN
jgi:tetratricopeptide (TPR) repeat protein